MVGHQLLELVMGVRILLPEHLLFQVICTWSLTKVRTGTT